MNTVFEPSDIKAIEKAIGHVFGNKQLLITAFTHASFSNENEAENNEKLEFLGDSLLNFVVSEFLFGNMPDEGALTTERAKIVSAEPLASAIKKLDLIRYMRLGAGVLTARVSPKFYSNLFEAIVGAIYLDGGINPSRRFISTNLVISDFSTNTDYKTRLQEYVQKAYKNKMLTYKDSFDQTARTFVSKVVLMGKELGEGRGVRKKLAQQNAARVALEKIESNLKSDKKPSKS